MILRVYGASDKIDACLSLLSHYRLVELVRSGKILMTPRAGADIEREG